VGALDQAVKSGKALYVGISNYSPDQTARAAELLRGLGTPCLIHQAKYNMFERWIEDGLLRVLGERGLGCIAFSPLAQGVLTDRYLSGIPEDSRAAQPHGFLERDALTPALLLKVGKLNELAQARGQSLSQMAIAWVLRHEEMTSALVGASRIEQIEAAVGALAQLSFSAEELASIDAILTGPTK
jgi:L-glyceraldehyde 3-phosphate reductase